MLIGGDWAGGRPDRSLVKNRSAKLEAFAIPTATTVSVDAATTIDASARRRGDGGKVILWSDSETTFAGTLREMLRGIVAVGRDEVVRGARRSGSILLDNMTLDDIRRAREMAGEHVILDVSGGVTRDTVRAIAETGVDIISVGALTHSARAVDISMRIEAA